MSNNKNNKTVLDETALNETFLNDTLVKDEIPGFGAPHEFIKKYRADKELQSIPHYQKLHEALISRSSVCSFCGVGCPFTVVKNKKGNERLIPLSDLGLCVKGQSSLISGSDTIRPKRLERHGISDDRIRAPMIRGHNGQLKEVSWDEALDRAAWLFLHVREWVGPESVAIYGNGQKTIEAIWMASLYKLVFNIPTMGANSEHCLSSAGAAHTLNFGNEASFTWQGFDELVHADVIVLHGTNPKITFPQVFKKVLRNKEAVKVVIDPITSDTAAEILKIDDRNQHIRFEQGGDIVFNLAVARIIFENNWQDEDYLQANVDPDSLKAFKALCFESRCELQNAAKLIAFDDQDGKDVEQTILNYAELFAKPKENGERPKVAIISSMGINQSTGSYGFSTNLNLLLITGNVGRKGAGSLRVAGQSNATSELMLGFNSRKLVFNLEPSNIEHRQELSSWLDIPIENIPDRNGTPVSKMADDDYLYCFIFIGTQFTKNMPRLGHWLRRIGRSFNIVIDSFMGEGVRENADVVFPSMTYTERTGVIQRGDRSLQLQQGLSPAPENAWSDEQVLARLAMKISERLRNPDTAALNNLDPDVVANTFGKYFTKDSNGNDTDTVDSAKVFDHVVSTSQHLDLYNRLEDNQGKAISHSMLRASAGTGIQWQGNGRYQSSQDNGQNHTKNNVFPSLRKNTKIQAKLVCPPDELIQRLITKDNENLRSLITGRGRPGMKSKHYTARYNSGVKTLPITGAEDDKYWIELHPDYAQEMGLAAGDLVRLTSYHGIVFSHVSLNSNVPKQFPFLDFVPGEVNRLTNYLDSDQFTNQSLIKRTPIRLEPVSNYENILWEKPDIVALESALSCLHEHLNNIYPEYQQMKAFFRREEQSHDWLSWATICKPETEQERRLSRSVASMAVFLQRFMNCQDYQKLSAEMLIAMNEDQRHKFYSVLMPILRKLDYSTALLPLLSACVGDMTMRDKAGKIYTKTLFEAHNSAVLELKEEVVGVQLYVALKRGLETLYGVGNPIPYEDIALVSGISIPCAGDVPAYLLGIAPSDLEARRLIHCRSIGGNSVMAIDCKNNRAVKVDVTSGILPKDKELDMLRGKVIAKKRAATRDEHRRFFDVLEELILEYVHAGDTHLKIYSANTFPAQEFKEKLSFSPAHKRVFREHLVETKVSASLSQALVQLNVLDSERDRDLLEYLVNQDNPSNSQDTQGRPYSPDSEGSFSSIANSMELSTQDKIEYVIKHYITPVLENDGGKIDFLDYNNDSGEVSVRFVGSCANCPCSMLSLETIVKPPLMKIEGVKHIVHRGKVKPKEIPTRAAIAFVAT